VFLEELVSGRNKTVSRAAMEEEYGVQTFRLILRETAEDSPLSSWLFKHSKSYR
jgi:hypothetical protein